jgi:hypothetical protein
MSPSLQTTLSLCVVMLVSGLLAYVMDGLLSGEWSDDKGV